MLRQDSFPLATTPYRCLTKLCCAAPPTVPPTRSHLASNERASFPVHRLPHYLVGHSMGGLAATLACVQRVRPHSTTQQGAHFQHARELASRACSPSHPFSRVPTKCPIVHPLLNQPQFIFPPRPRACAATQPGRYAGLVLIAPMLSLAHRLRETGNLRYALKLLAAMAPKLEVGDSSTVRHVPWIYDAWDADPYVYDGRMRARNVEEFFKATEQLNWAPGLGAEQEGEEGNGGAEDGAEGAGGKGKEGAEGEGGQDKKRKKGRRRTAKVAPGPDGSPPDMGMMTRVALPLLVFQSERDTHVEPDGARRLIARASVSGSDGLAGSKELRGCKRRVRTFWIMCVCLLPSAERNWGGSVRVDTHHTGNVCLTEPLTCLASPILQTHDKTLRMLTKQWHVLSKEEGWEDLCMETVEWLAARADGRGPTAEAMGGSGGYSTGQQQPPSNHMPQQHHQQSTPEPAQVVAAAAYPGPPEPHPHSEPLSSYHQPEPSATSTSGPAARQQGSYTANGGDAAAAGPMGETLAGHGHPRFPHEQHEADGGVPGVGSGSVAAAHASRDAGAFEEGSSTRPSGLPPLPGSGTGDGSGGGAVPLPPMPGGGHRSIGGLAPLAPIQQRRSLGQPPPELESAPGGAAGVYMGAAAAGSAAGGLPPLRPMTARSRLPPI